MASVIIRNRDKRKEKEPSSLDQLVKIIGTGLNIAQAGYGIQAKQQQIELGKLRQQQVETQIAEEAVTGAGDFTPKALAQFQKKGGQVFETPEAGTRPVALKTPGMVGPAQQLHIKTPELIKQEKEAAALARKVESERDKEEFKRFSSLQSGYTKASKNTFSALEGYRKVQAAATGEQTGASDLALIFGFMKTLDPGSTVREGEFANAENAQGVEAKVRNLYNKVRAGTRLDPAKRDEFLQASTGQMLAQLEVQEGTDQQYADLAENFGVRPQDVLNQQFSIAKRDLENIIQRSRAVAQRVSPGLPGETEAQAAQPFNPDEFLGTAEKPLPIPGLGGR